MRIGAAILLLTLAWTLPGCLSNDAPTDAGLDAVDEHPDLGRGNDSSEASESAWSLQADFALGWIVGIGANTFLGDHTVGLHASDEGQCPRFNFFVPETASNVAITVDAVQGVDPSGAGVGSYQFVISNQELIQFTLPTAAGTEYQFDQPTPGIWDLWVDPNGAAANLAWPVQVVVNGTSPHAQVPDDLYLKKYGDCMP